MFAAFGARLDGGSAHLAALTCARWLELVDALAGLPASAFAGAAVDVGYDGRWVSCPHARGLVAMDNASGGREFSVWVALRIDAQRVKSGPT